MIGAGGALVEVLSDRVFAEPPLDLARAKALLGRLQARRLLVGLRGMPACNEEAVAEAIVRLSALATDVG
jgi:ATP-grasp domain-containing protein